MSAEKESAKLTNLIKQIESMLEQEFDKTLVKYEEATKNMHDFFNEPEVELGERPGEYRVQAYKTYIARKTKVVARYDTANAAWFQFTVMNRRLTKLIEEVNKC